MVRDRRYGRYLLKNVPESIPHEFVVHVFSYMERNEITTFDFKHWKGGQPNGTTQPKR